VAQTTAVRPDRNLNERAMADCEETLRELEAFLDGELDVDDLSLVRSHIDGCMDCLQAYDFYAELRVVIKQKCREQEVPPGLLDRVKSCFGDDAAELLDRPPQGPSPTSA
jgi:anti-sigma factor (TIGR02949 family)